MRKRLAVISAVAVAALALYMLHVPVVEVLARDALGERGIAVQSLEVHRVSLDELALANIVLGRNREFKARAVVVSWHFAGLFGVVLTQVLVDGARLDVNLADGAPLSVRYKVSLPATALVRPRLTCRKLSCVTPSLSCDRARAITRLA